MRIRDERLRSGRLLGWFDPEDRQRSSALMLLVRGIDDIEPLTRIERACGRALEAGEQGGFDWHHGDLGELASVDPMLAPSRVSRIEVAELAMLSTEEVEELLGPALTRLSSGEIQLFPAAGGAVGSPAEGIQFFGRDREVRDAVTRLKTGQSLEILAPRRSGKSSLMRRLHESLPEDWQGVFVNMEKEYTPEDLAARFWGLATGEPYRAGQRRAEEGWEKLTATAVGRLTAGSEVLVLLLDELVSFLQDQAPGEEGGSSAALTVLGALGRICDNPRVRLVTASSLPLAEYLHESLGLPRDRLPSFFRSLEALRLQPLDFPAPELELRRVLLGTGLVPEADDLEWLNENVGLALPYPALRFLDFLASRLRAHGPAGEEDLERLLAEFLDATDAFGEFESNLKRRGQQTGGLRALRACLDCLAMVEPGAAVPKAEVEECLEGTGRPEHLFAWLLETFPVVEREDDGVALASRLFRRWWRHQLNAGR